MMNELCSLEMRNIAFVTWRDLIVEVDPLPLLRLILVSEHAWSQIERPIPVVISFWELSLPYHFRAREVAGSCQTAGRQDFTIMP